MVTRKDDAKLSVRITPGAKRNAVIALREGVWHIKIAAPPVEGKANEELVAFLSKILDIRKNSLSVLKGHTSRTKLISVAEINQEEIYTQADSSNRWLSFTLPDFFAHGGLGGMSAGVTLVALGLEYHFVMADGARFTGTGPDVTALQAVVYPAMLVDIQKKYLRRSGGNF